MHVEAGTRAHAYVLNAFRHHRGRHNANVSHCASWVVCSTPFGITEVGTGSNSRRTRPHSGAQRLSASQRSARPISNASAPSSIMCSTPFGITEVGTFRVAVDQGVAVGCSTPFGITEVGTPPPASSPDQDGVLNAFRHHRGRHDNRLSARLGCDSCSTPFGITEVGTLLTLFGLVTSIPVLNAFRHHRGRHHVATSQ